MFGIESGKPLIVDTVASLMSTEVSRAGNFVIRTLCGIEIANFRQTQSRRFRLKETKVLKLVA